MAAMDVEYYVLPEPREAILGRKTSDAQGPLLLVLDPAIDPEAPEANSPQVSTITLGKSDDGKTTVHPPQETWMHELGKDMEDVEALMIALGAGGLSIVDVIENNRLLRGNGLRVGLVGKGAPVELAALIFETLGGKCEVIRIGAAGQDGLERSLNYVLDFEIDPTNFQKYLSYLKPRGSYITMTGARTASQKTDLIATSTTVEVPVMTLVGTAYIVQASAGGSVKTFLDFMKTHREKLSSLISTKVPHNTVSPNDADQYKTQAANRHTVYIVKA